jgi:hypothetical protein
MNHGGHASDAKRRRVPPEASNSLPRMQRSGQERTGSVGLIETQSSDPARGAGSGRLHYESGAPRFVAVLLDVFPASRLAQGRSPLAAGIIGAGRSCTAWMISVLSIPRR